MADHKYLQLGKKNLADAVTALVKSGVGPALRLLVDSGPPLEVNSQDKVDNLNSDMLDDRHAHELTGVSQLRIGGEPPLVPPDTMTYGKLSLTPPARGYIRLTGNVTFTHDLSKVTDPQPGQVPGGGLVQGTLRIIPFIGGPSSPSSDSVSSFEDIKGREYANLALDGLFLVAASDTRVEILISRGREGPGVGPIYALFGALTAQYAPYELPE